MKLLTFVVFIQIQQKVPERVRAVLSADVDQGLKPVTNQRSERLANHITVTFLLQRMSVAVIIANGVGDSPGRQPIAALGRAVTSGMVYIV